MIKQMYERENEKERERESEREKKLRNAAVTSTMVQIYSKQ